MPWWRNLRLDSSLLGGGSGVEEKLDPPFRQRGLLVNDHGDYGLKFVFTTKSHQQHPGTARATTYRHPPSHNRSARSASAACPVHSVPPGHVSKA